MSSVMMTDRGGWVYAPTIATLRDVLDHMEREGVGLGEPLLISHLDNALGTYIVSPLDRRLCPVCDRVVHVSGGVLVSHGHVDSGLCAGSGVSA